LWRWSWRGRRSTSSNGGVGHQGSGISHRSHFQGASIVARRVEEAIEFGELSHWTKGRAVAGKGIINDDAALTYGALQLAQRAKDVFLTGGLAHDPALRSEAVFGRGTYAKLKTTLGAAHGGAPLRNEGIVELVSRSTLSADDVHSKQPS